MTTVRTKTKFDATRQLKYSPRKARLLINELRGKTLSDAMNILPFINKGASKDVYNLLKSAASNLGIVESDYGNFVIKTIVAEEAQKLYRVMPRARGSAARIRRRYSRIKVEIASK